MRHRVAAIVYDAHLHTTGMAAADVEQSELRPVESVGEIIDGKLCPAHIRRTDIRHACQLHSLFHAHRHIGKASHLHAMHRCGGGIGEASHLEAVDVLGNV